jgi:hypothetical protein
VDVMRILAIKPADWLARQGGVWPESDPSQRMHEFRMVLFFLAALVLLVWLIARIQGRMQVAQAPHRPWRVFWCLLKYHGLGVSDRLLLGAIAFSQGLKQPAVLLLSPSLFTRYAIAWLGDSHLGSIWPGAKERLTRVAHKVFTEPSGSAEKPAEAASAGE